MQLKLNGWKGFVLGLAPVLFWSLADLVCDRFYHDFACRLIIFGAMAAFGALAGYQFGRLYQHFQELSITDPLTGTYNRNFFIPESDRQLSLAQRHHYPVSLALVDLDSFKGYNDTRGHLAGDQLLRKVADCFRQNLRRTDTLARFGGDEFVFLLPHTPNAEARQLMRRIVGEACDACVTMSVGVATYPEDGVTLDELLRQADEEMYLSKGCRWAENQSVPSSVSVLDLGL
ncbi:MAG: GGDEF domain-containing protein [Bacillota bacterium]|nr:GGDEF domain-containing protein [Bacillota bacterium]